MNIDTSSYQKHVDIVKDFKMADDFYEVREPYKEAFQKIHDDAQENGVNVSNAKEYLNSLSEDELSTLQNYTRLADEIDVDTLSDEGAYNLLLEHYEKYDFNNDGITEDGAAKTMPLIPYSMPDDEKKALVNTFNSMEFKDVMTTSVLLMSPTVMVNGELQADGNAKIDFDYIQQKIEYILDPKNKNSSTQEFKDTIKFFWDTLMSNYSQTMEQKAYYGIA